MIFNSILIDNETSKRLDFLKVLACLFVISIHITAERIYNFQHTNFWNWNITNLFNSLARCAVPIFVMVSGITILSKPIDSISEFYFKRLKKILIPLLVWSVVYYVFEGLREGSQYTPNIQHFIKVFTKGATHFHLWYLYMILGLYVFAPFLKRFCDTLTSKQAYSLLFIWLISFNIPSTINQILIYFKFNDYTFFFPSAIFGEYFAYFILGYLLFKFPPKWKAQIFFYIYMISTCVISILTYVEFKVITMPKLLFYEYQYTFVFIQSLSFVLFILKLKTDKKFNFIRKLAPYTFGIYPIHVLIIEMLNDGLIGFKLDITFADTIISFIPMLLIIALSSTTIIFGLSKIPFVKRII